MTTSKTHAGPVSPRGLAMPRLGLGTWRIGERAADRAQQVAAIRHAIELGYRLFDTAEMYGEGGAERVLGQALGDSIRAGDVDRSSLFVVSKVYPHHASRGGVVEACRRSLERLGLDRIDLYLLHWRGQYALAETIDGFEQLSATGLISHWGVSNFDVEDMRELFATEGGTHCAANQIYLSLSQRGAGHSLLPWLQQAGVSAMAYSPIDQGTLAASAALQPIASRLGVSPVQVALAWLLRQPGVVAIPKALQPLHQRENFEAQHVELDAELLNQIDRIFPPPTRKQPLAMI